MDKTDLIAFFQEFRTSCISTESADILTNSDNCAQIDEHFDGYNISKLDVRRMYRFLDKTSKKDFAVAIEDDFLE